MTRTRIRPNLCASYDEDKNSYEIEIELPGVKKSDIDLKMLSGGFLLTAPKGDIEYRGDYVFACPIEADKSEAEYDNGLLTIWAPLSEPYEGAKKVEVK